MLGFLHFVLLALAAYRLTRLIVEDTIFERPREALFNRFPPESTKIGYLFTCYHCMGLWIATFTVVCYILIPTATIIAALVLAISAIVGLISER
ncbi:MAG: DUF1360 domain-containing protein [Cetobacterium sp.]